MKNLIIFDLDGVITSEEAYWDCAGLTLHELLYSPRYWHVSDNTSYKPAANALESRRLSRATLPEWLILSFKARALNSNWDTCYAAVCLHLLDLLCRLPEPTSLLPLTPADPQWIERVRTAIKAANLASTWDAAQLHARWREQHPFDHPLFAGATGLHLFERLDAYASELLSHPIENVFARRQPFWRFCQDLFQEWLLGDTLYAQTYGHPPAQTDKPGCLFFEEALLPTESLRATLESLQKRGYTLGIASGRIFQEAEKPLEKNGLLGYFDPAHIGTYDLVTRGEKLARAQQITTMLGKPHAFHFQAAVDWERALQNVLSGTTEPLPTPFIAVGDSTSDILGGRAAGALTVAVLTGARTPEARALFLQSQPDFVINDVLSLPALLDEIENLTLIQKLQFERREVAEKLLRLWFARQMDLATEQVRLTPKAVSLNSFNGFYTSAGQEFFFKTHVEEHGVLDEYYHADLLDQAGYNVVRPLSLVREKERQMVVYPVITAPVMFDLMRAQETGQTLPTGITIATLLQAEQAECQHLLDIYARTLQPEQDTSKAPIHQLFWHRLSKRFYEFYSNKTFPLPASKQNTDDLASTISFQQLMSARWTINGVEQPQTLAELVAAGQRVLDPTRPSATVVGHGDAHFGNVFLEQYGETRRYLYFDPAFAGHHSPLLDVVKPLFHNVFAMWMYFPQEIVRDLRIAVRIEDESIIVEHNYRLTPVRQGILRVKQEELLTPLQAFLKAHNALPENWQQILRLALMCCPLLTVDLFDETKRPPEIGWLGLSQALQSGNGGIAAWREEQ